MLGFAYLIVATTMVKAGWDLFRGYGCLFGGTSATKIRDRRAEMGRSCRYAGSGSWSCGDGSYGLKRGVPGSGERLADGSVSQLLALAVMADSGRRTYESSCRRRRRRVLRGLERETPPVRLESRF